MRVGGRATEKGCWEILHHSVCSSSGPWQQSNRHDLCACRPTSSFFQLVKWEEVKEAWRGKVCSGLSTCWVHPQYVHMIYFLDFGICWKCESAFLLVVHFLCSDDHCECMCETVWLCAFYLHFQMIFCCHKTRTQQTCMYRICKLETLELRRWFASSLSNKKGIFSVFYIAFLEDDHHSTINYNKNKG